MKWNRVNDSMHTFLEGILPYIFGLILETLVAVGHLTVDELNDSMSKVMSQLEVDFKKKPNYISFQGGKIYIKLSSAKMWLTGFGLDIYLCL